MGAHSSGLNIMSKLSRSLGDISGQMRTRVAASLSTFLSIIRTSIACNVMGSDSTASFVEGLGKESSQRVKSRVKCDWGSSAVSEVAGSGTHLSVNNQGPSAFLPQALTAETTCLI